MSLGPHFSIICSEDLPLAGAGARSGFGAQLQDEYGFCEDWPRADFPKAFRRPAQAETPALLISGEFDPVTPPASAREMARGLANSRVIVVPGSAHSAADPQGCVNRAISSFFEQGSPDAEALGCIARIHRPHFEVRQ